jgi:hypothetical protein
MKKVPWIVDVSIDTGGCFETLQITSHENPLYKKVMYCIIVSLTYQHDTLKPLPYRSVTSLLLICYKSQMMVA